MICKVVISIGLCTSAAGAQTIAAVAEAPPNAAELPFIITGRTTGETPILRQWPGTYFETAFEGREVLFRTGPGRAAVNVSADHGSPSRLPDSTPGLCRVAGLSAGEHRLRVQIVGETQGEPTGFGGFFAPPKVRASPRARRDRQIEFVGDSHTVGYAIRSAKRDCTDAEVADSTDTSTGLAGLLAGRYGANYQVNAISGRGVIRKYNGGPGDVVPEAYPFALLDRSQPYAKTHWKPRLIVVAFGTNDFSTALRPDECWVSRAALRAEFEQRYAAFLRALRRRHSQAYLLAWAADIAGGEIEREANAAVELARAAGERRIDFVSIDGLSLTACHFHPSIRDGAAIAARLARSVDRRAHLWAQERK